MLFTITTFIGFTALVALISWWKTRNDNLHTQDGYFLAGRGLGGIVIAGSLLLTNLSAEQLVGTNGQAFAVGMSPMAWEVTSSLALAILAFVFLPKYLKSGITTVPQFLEERYDSTTRRVVSILFLIAYIVTMLPVILYAGALVFERVFKISDIFQISQFSAIAFVCLFTGIIGSIYAIFGGLKAVAVSDTINGVGLIIGGLLVPILGFIALGQVSGGGFLEGVQAFATLEPEKMNAIDPANALPPYMPWPLLFTGLLANNLYFWCTNQSIIQRTLAGKNLKEAQKGAIVAGFFKIACPLILIVPGIIAYHLYPDLISSQDMAYPILVTKIIPEPLLGFFAAVMFGAILSSFNSVLNSATTIYCLDIHRPVFNKDITDEKLVNVGKYFGIVVAAVSISIAPFIMNFGGGVTTFINEFTGFFSMPILAAVVIGFFTKRVPAIAPKIAIVCHIVLYGATKVIPFFASVHYLYAVGGLFLIDMGIMLLVGKFYPRETDYIQVETHVVEMVPWKRGAIYSGIALFITVLAYIVFSPLVLGK